MHHNISRKDNIRKSSLNMSSRWDRNLQTSNWGRSSQRWKHRPDNHQNSHKNKFTIKIKTTKVLLRGRHLDSRTTLFRPKAQAVFIHHLSRHPASNQRNTKMLEYRRSGEKFSTLLLMEIWMRHSSSYSNLVSRSHNLRWFCVFPQATDHGRLHTIKIDSA